jgi:drug/metabolite transporter (DMT)-like permease
MAPGAANVLFAAFLFATSEIVLGKALRHVSVDICFKARIAVALAICLFVFAAKPFILAKAGELLARHTRWALMRAVAWALTVIFLTIAFQYSSKQTFSYVFFSLHPIWAFLLSRYYFRSIKGSPLLAIGVAVTIAGVCIFALAPFLKSDPAQETESWFVHVASLLGGILFAATNTFTSHLTKQTDFLGERVREEPIQLVTYALCFTMVPLVPVLIEGLKLDVGVLPKVADFPQNNFIVLWSRSLDCSVETLLFGFLLLVSVISWWGNQQIAIGMGKGDAGLLSALELTSVLMTAVIEIAFGETLGIIALAGLCVILAGAALTAFAVEAAHIG